MKILLDTSVIVAASLSQHPSHTPCFAQMTALNLPGGGIYDALIARAASKVTADQLMTLNPKHFTRLDPAIAQIVVVPS